MPIKPLLNKPLFLPFAWLQLVLEKNTMSSHLLTKHSIGVWNQCEDCFFTYLHNTIAPNNTLYLLQTKILQQETDHIKLSVYNETFNLTFNLYFYQNDWYIDLRNMKDDIKDDCVSCIEH